MLVGSRILTPWCSRGLAAFALCAALGAPSSSVAQTTDDPCHAWLEGDELQEYDALVGAYIEASTAGSAEVQVAVLTQLEGLCSDNLRLSALRADALAALGECRRASEAYRLAISRAGTHANPIHAEQAKLLAQDGLARLEAACRVDVSATCTPAATVRVDDRAFPCPGSFTVLAGEYEVVAEQEGFQAVQRLERLEPGSAELVFTLEPAQGRLQLECSDAALQILVDGRVFRCGDVVTAAAGPVTLELRSPQHEGPVVVNEAVEPNSERTVHLALPAPIETPTPVTHEQDNTLAWTVGGVGVATTGAGVACLVLAAQKRGAVDDAERNPLGQVVGMSQQEAAERYETAARLDVAGVTTLAVGVAALGVASYLFLDASSDAAAALLPTKDGALLGLVVTF